MKDKQNVGFIHLVEYYSSHQKDWTTGTCYCMDETWKHFAVWTQKTTYYMTLLIWNVQNRQILEIESRLVVAKDGGMGMPANGYRVSFQRYEMFWN